LSSSSKPGDESFDGDDDVDRDEPNVDGTAQDIADTLGPAV
jgi:hypothetical protein